MPDISGDFEIHLTFQASDPANADVAVQHGLKYSEIVLERGRVPVQPMVTVAAQGTFAQVEQLSREWADRFYRRPVRVKIEAAPWNAGVPVEDTEAVRGRYFEHHVKLLLPNDSLDLLAALLAPHHAHLSRNARRRRTDGKHERFVTQRCHQVGRNTSKPQLEALVTTLREAGYDILEIEEEYVVLDTHEDLDTGWLEAAIRTEPIPAGYPATYLPIAPSPGIEQRRTFDPALKQYDNAFRPGQPTFAQPERGTEWQVLRRSAIHHLLTLIATSELAEHLVLRGSITLQHWYGDQAREPGDLDFVVIPAGIGVDSPEGRGLLETVIATVAANPGPGFKAAEVARDELWTYDDRLPGRRLVFPYEHDGLSGTLQLDFVYNEDLPIEPERLPIGNVSLLTVSPELSLAWKILWLATDAYPQGKDLYDAVLLAERTDVSPLLIQQLLDNHEDARHVQGFTPSMIQEWDVDWQNFLDEYPAVEGDAESWKERLAAALRRSYSRPW
ncbi:nucleotidyl transferase AbiEii/AbiGii toxin family protein [Kribbella sp. NPDC056345]|uniref:nucleotidyl transferase AbiEii/AbiGii toxin family protein n=1 Tax=Kribbella sp. NPDC056345 TaxID=3345789 RepID=UPI0035E36995